jgi:hypothetical protein
MKMSVCTALLVSLTFCSSQAISQEALYPDYAHRGKSSLLHGQGANSCGTFIAEKQPDRLQTSIHAQEMAWVLGFLHGIDQWNPYNTKSYDYDGLDLWLEEYCKKHPLDPLANAANKFYSAIGGRAPMSEDYTIWKHYPDYDPRGP